MVNKLRLVSRSNLDGISNLNTETIIKEIHKIKNIQKLKLTKGVVSIKEMFQLFYWSWKKPEQNALANKKLK